MADQTGYGPAPTNSSFTAGLSLLFQDPGAFGSVLVDTITGGDTAINAVPVDEIRKAATEPLVNVLPTIPLWVKIALIGGTVAVGLVAAAYITHKVA